MTTLMLAVRNLLRNRRRSIATLLAMAIGSSAILMFGGYSTNIKYTMQTAYVREGGHLQIQQRDFFTFGSGNPTAYGIADYDKIIKAIHDDEVLRDMVLIVTPTLQFGGIAGNYAAGVSRTVIGIGRVAADVNRLRKWDDLDAGLAVPLFPLEGAPQDNVVVGIGVARVLQLCAALQMADCPQPVAEKKESNGGKGLPDDIAALSAQETPSSAAAPAADQRRIELLASNPNGAPNVASLDVIKAESQGFKEFDEVAVILQLAQAQRLIYGKIKPKVTSLMVQLRHTSQIAAAQARLETLLQTVVPEQTLSVRDFQSLNPFYTQTLQLFDTIFGFIFALIGGIVLFTVSNTMNTAVVERTVEIGTLRAIGLRRGGIRLLFLLEGLLLGLAGAILGVVCALSAAFVINRMGLTWLPPGSALRLAMTLRIWGETQMIAGTTLGLIVIAAVSAWWPAYRAANLGVVDALRHV